MNALPLRRSVAVLAVALFALSLLTGAATAQTAPSVAVAEVTGPIPATSEVGGPAHGYTFLATDYDLAGHGYVEEEFFLSGQATSYAVDGISDATVRSTGHNYTTRIVVRRPIDPADFNGTVIAEWYNVSNLWDQEVDWFQTHEHLVRSGYAWVGVSAQRAGVHSATGLRAWSPDRYGDLDLTDGGTVTDDTLSWDVFSQAVNALRDPVDTAPLGPLEAEHVIATGHSQSAGRLWGYVNSVDPLAGVVDAVVLHGGGPPIRDDIDTPVFKLNSETDVAIDLLGAAQRQPDTERLVTWEVAGSSHGDWKLITDYGRLRIRDIGTAPGGYPGTPQTCTNPSGSRIPQHMVQSTLYDHIVDWVAGGTQPPSAPPIVLEDGTVARDDLGLGLGGIRLAQQEVPVRLNSGLNSGPGFCFIDGSSIPVADATLAEWYPDEDDYVDEVVATTADAVEAGYLHDDFARDPAWYSDVVELVAARTADGRLDTRATDRLLDRVERAAAVADAGDLRSALRWMRQADVFAEHQLRGNDDAIATVARQTAAVVGILEFSGD
jgi:hypothetical protein